MSLLWRDQLHISLSPSHVAIQRLGKGFRRPLKANLSKACDDSAAGKDSWSAALATLESILCQAEWQQGEATIILSNAFTRFLLLPWNEHIAGAEELRSFAQHKMAAVYGDSSEWEMRIAAGNSGTENLACGIQRRLLQALSACGEKHHLQLRSVQPYLMTAYNRVRPELARGNICFAAAEAGRVCFMRLENGAWKSIHCRSIKTGDPLAELVKVLEREQQLSAIAGKTDRALLYAPGITPARLAAATKKTWQLTSSPARTGPDWRIDFPIPTPLSASA